eukprot:jgi/Chrzof1/4794/UNPLg00798.t1
MAVAASQKNATVTQKQKSASVSQKQQKNKASGGTSGSQKHKHKKTIAGGGGGGGGGASQKHLPARHRRVINRVALAEQNQMQTLLASNMRLAAELRSRDLADAERRRMAMEQQAFEQHPLTRARQVVEKHQQEALKRAAKPVSMAKLDKEYHDAEEKSNWQWLGEVPMDLDPVTMDATVQTSVQTKAPKPTMSGVSVDAQIPGMVRVPLAPSGVIAEQQYIPINLGKRQREHAYTLPTAKRQKPATAPFVVGVAPVSTPVSAPMLVDMGARKRPRKLVGPPATVPFLFPG